MWGGGGTWCQLTMGSWEWPMREAMIWVRSGEKREEQCSSEGCWDDPHTSCNSILPKACTY